MKVKLSIIIILMILISAAAPQIAISKSNSNQNEIPHYAQGHSLKTVTIVENVDNKKTQKVKNGFKVSSNFKITKEKLSGSFVDEEDTKNVYNLEGMKVKTEKGVIMYEGQVTNVPGKIFEGFLLPSKKKINKLQF